MEFSATDSWLRLIRAKLPYVRKLQLCGYHPGAGVAPHIKDPEADSATVFRKVTPAELRCLNDRSLSADVVRDLAWIEAPEHGLVTLNDSRYPARLREIARPPLALFVAGDVTLLDKPQIAIVGSRNPSPAGFETAREFASGLAKLGFCVTSGHARGIDTASHQGALDVEAGTVAVFATGPERVYPYSNRRLAENILQNGGATVTEFPVGVAPHARNFPRRNRVISGLCLGTLVVEAALRSGSLITARYALEQGREVFAIPGSIHNPLSRGCHHLIRQGARLVEKLDDILEEFEWLNTTSVSLDTAGGNSCNELMDGLDDVSVRVLSALGFDASDFDRLLERSGLSPELLSARLMELELRGLVCKSAGFFSRSPSRQN